MEYEIKTVINGKRIVHAETAEKAIESIEIDNAIRVVSIQKLGVPPKPSLREPGCYPVEIAELYTKLDATTDPEERAKIIAELEQIKYGER